MKSGIFHTKIKAGALQYTIFISVVIALLIFAFISLSFVHQKQRIKTTYFQEVINTTNQSFEYLNHHKIPYKQQTPLPSFNPTKTSTTTYKTHWGIFDKITITTNKKKESFTKTALLAGSPLQRTALYIEDQNQPLVLVGNTHIEGTTYLPKQGVKRGTIAGHSYTGSQLIYGNIATSTNKLPQLQNSEYLRTFIKNPPINYKNNHTELQENTKQVYPFSKPTQLINSQNTIDLRFTTLIGNIIIHSDKKIVVHATATLKDVILIAPEIKIAEKTIGNFQALATQQITVGKNCKLSYPTALILLEKQTPQSELPIHNPENHQIYIDKNNQIKGVIAYITKNTTNNYTPQIIIEENTTITGEVYCNQNLEHKGIVKGSIYTKAFVANQFGSVYKNHLYNSKILGNDLPSQYAGLSFKETPQKIVKWLNY